MWEEGGCTGLCRSEQRRLILLKIDAVVQRLDLACSILAHAGYVKTARLTARCSAQSREVWNALVRADGVVRFWSSTRLAQLAHRPLHVDEVHHMLGVMLVARNGALIDQPNGSSINIKQ